MIMAVKNKKNQKGQALFEFLFFFPLLISFLFIIVGVGNSINGAINQQKVTRGYFYARIKNSSEFPLRDEQVHSRFQLFGMFFIGWRERFADGGQTPLLPCYKINLPLERENQRCEVAYTNEQTHFIKVGTVYGVCGHTYVRSQGSIVPLIATEQSSRVATRQACEIR